MAQVAKVRCTIPANDPLDDNVSFSTYWQQVGTITDVNDAHIDTMLGNFLNGLSGSQVATLASYLAPSLSRASGAVLLEHYDISTHLDGSPAGSPYFMSTLTLGAESGSDASYPAGVAQTIGYRVDYGTDVEFGTGTRPRARDRNRIYLGPLNASAFTNDTTTKRCKNAVQFDTDCLQAMGTMGTLPAVGADMTTMGVWSRAAAHIRYPVFECWVDDRPDYQRRRSDPGVKTSLILADI